MKQSLNLLWSVTKYSLKFGLYSLAAIILFLFLFLGSSHLYRHTPHLISALTPFQLQAEIEGHFFSQQQWHHLSFQGAGVELEAQHLALKIDWFSLFKKKFQLEQLQLSHGQLKIHSENQNNSSESASFQWPEEINIPLELELKQIALKDFAIRQKEELLLHIEDAALDVWASKNEVVLKHHLKSNMLDLNLAAKTELKGQYPLDLHLESELKLPSFQEKIQLTATESLLHPHIRIQTRGDIDADMLLKGQIQPEQKSFNLQLNWHDLDYLKQYQSSQGEIQISGKENQIQMQSSGHLKALDYPEIPWQLSALMNQNHIQDLKLHLQTAEGSASLMGDVHLDALKWNASLDAQNIALQHFVPDLDAHIQSLTLTTTGSQQEALKASVDIHNLNAQWQHHPLAAQGSLHYEHNHLDIAQFKFQWADNYVHAHGHLKEHQNAMLQLKLHAPQLHAFLPELKGVMEGELSIQGNITNPHIDGQLNWNQIAYTEGKNVLFSSPHGHLNIQGDLNHLVLKTKIHAQGKDIPPLSLTGETQLNAERIKHMQWQAELLKGQLDLTGHVQYSPLTWHIKSDIKNIQPDAFYPEIKALLNGQLESQGQIDEQGLNTTVHLHDVSGLWQKQKLQLQGQANIQPNFIEAQNLHLKLGENQMLLNGNLKDKILALQFQLKAPHLASFLPQLKGQLQAEGTLQGSIEKPHLKLNAQGQNIAFENHQIQHLNIKMDNAFYTGGILNNDIQLQGLNLAEQKFKKLQLKSEGQFHQHQIQLQIDGEQNVQLQLKGGLKSLNHWQGLLQQLQLSAYNHTLKLKKPTPINLNPESIKVEDLCLLDSYSDFCLSLHQEKEMVLKYGIQQLDSRSFQYFIPKNMKISTSLSGQGHLQMNKQGALKGQHHLSFKPGQIVIPLENQAPLVIQLRKANIEALLNQQQLKTKAEIDLGKMGQLNWEAFIQDLNRKPQIQSYLAAHVDDIGVFRNYVPKVNQLKGKITGKMSFQGALAQPQINGEIHLENGKVTIPEYATELDRIHLQLKAGKTGEIDILGKIGTPDGDMNTQGTLILYPLKLDLNLKGKNMLLANSKTLKVHVTPEFNIRIDPQQGVHVKGNILIPQAKIDIPDTSSAIAISEDVVIVNQEKPKNENKKESPFYADIQVQLGDQVFFKNKDVNIRLIGDLNIKMRPNEAILGQGRIKVANGLYYLYGQELNIKRGWVTFSGANIANPIIDFRASREIQDVEVGAIINGSAKNLSLKLHSEPFMPDSFIISYLLFGKPPSGSMSSSDLLDVAANMAIGQFTGGFAETMKLDVFNLSVNGLKAGKNITQDLYVGMNNDFLNALTQFIARYKFNKRLRLEATASQNEQTVDFTYEYEKN